MNSSNNRFGFFKECEMQEVIDYTLIGHFASSWFCNLLSLNHRVSFGPEFKTSLMSHEILSPSMPVINKGNRSEMDSTLSSSSLLPLSAYIFYITGHKCFPFGFCCKHLPTGYQVIGHLLQSVIARMTTSKIRVKYMGYKCERSGSQDG